MKTEIAPLWIAAVLCAAGIARREVVATAQSPDDSFPAFRVVLDALEQPEITAAFMGLADGSQRWLDPASGRVRGGNGDAFYADMVFDWYGDGVVQGGLKGIVGEGGTLQYTGGTGFTVPGKDSGGWDEVPAGALVAVEGDGPHAWHGELALHATNATTPWTMFGRVAPGGESAVETLAACVAQAPTAVQWSVDASSATAQERESLSLARARLPLPGGLEARVADGGRRFAFEWPARARLGILAAGNLDAPGLQYVAGGWQESEQDVPLDLGWEDVGLSGHAGFVSLTQVAYPAWSGHLFSGKWRMGMDHTGQRLQYWFDFDAKTGMVAVVVGGEIAERATFTQVSAWRETGNSVAVYYGKGMLGTFYYLGFAETGATGGRFMSRQISASGNVNTDWGNFEMAEGWEDCFPASKAERRMPPAARWVPWNGGIGNWNADGILLPDGPRDAVRGNCRALPNPVTRDTSSTP